MITEINGDKIVVEQRGKPAGVYSIKDFSTSELMDERHVLTGTIKGGTAEIRKRHEVLEKLNNLIDTTVEVMIYGGERGGECD